MNDKLKNTLKIVIFFAVGIFIFWWVYKDQDTDKIKESLKNANWLWICLSCVLAFLSHWSRAVRWNILIEPLGYKPRRVNTLLSIFIMYLSNMAIPRSGEIARCGTLTKYEKIPFTKLLGTVFIDRVFDFIMLVILLGVVLVVQFPIVGTFIANNPAIQERFDNLFASWTSILAIIGIGIFGLIILFVLREKIKKTIIYKKAYEMLSNIFEGLKTVKSMEKKGAFIFHTVFIWVLYFVMIYVCFFAFEATAHLDLVAGLTIFVMASFGMVIPSPGGIGTWHFMVIETLKIYGIAASDASAFAFATHGSMTLFLIIAGVISFILLPIVNKDNDIKTEVAG